MTDERNTLTDDDLVQMFSQMASQTPAPSEDLLARVVADAQAHRPVPGLRVGKARETFFEALISMLGGWAGAGGLAMAGVVGLWVGFYPPSFLETTATEFWSMIDQDVTDGWSDFGDIL